MVKKKYIITILILLLALSVLLFVIKVIWPVKKEGVISNISELPYAGHYLAGFQTLGEINYAYSVNHRGEYSIFFSGVTSLDHFNSFFSEEDGGQIVEEYAPQWIYQLGKMGLDLKKFPIDNSEENVRGVRRFDGAFVEVHYIKQDEKFTGRIYKIPATGTNSSDTR